MKLLLAANNESIYVDSTAAKLAEWVDANHLERTAGKLTHSLVRAGFGSKANQEDPGSGSGWCSLHRIVDALTAGQRRFVETHSVGDILRATVHARVKKGYLVHLDSEKAVTAFLPGSQWDTALPADWDKPVGQTCEVKILALDTDSLSILVSRRALLEPAQATSREDAIAALAVGQVINGTVVNIVDYGLFIDVGGINGLLHESKLIDRSAESLRSRYGEGDQMRVRIFEIDSDRLRISLEEHLDPAVSQARDAERRRLLQCLEAGQVCDGIIANIVDYGLFVDMGGINGLLHHSKLSAHGELALETRYTVGDPLCVQIIDIDRENERIALAEHVDSDPEQADRPVPNRAFESLEVGQVHDGIVVAIVKHGLYIDVDGLQGLLHRSRLISGSVGDLQRFYNVGEEMTVRVFDLDEEDRRVQFEDYRDPEATAKLEEERRDFLQSLAVGQTLLGTVVHIAECGFFVDLGVMDGLLRRSEFRAASDEDASLQHRKGDLLRVEIIDIDLDRGRIGLAECPPDAGNQGASKHDSHDTPD